MTSPKSKIRLAILVSGSGTTMEAIVRAISAGKLTDVEPALVISSTRDADALDRARNLGIPTEDILVIRPKDFKTPTEFGEEIIKECEKRNVNLIGQYGWHALTPKNVLDKYPRRVINQHPGPLDNGRPDFGGAGMFGIRVTEARLEFVRNTNRDFWTEVTTHFVTEEFDKGEIIKMRQIPILPEDTAESLHKRILPIEHEVQIEALQDFANDKVEITGRERPLVQTGEEKILEECKKNAMRKYPNG